MLLSRLPGGLPGGCLDKAGLDANLVVWLEVFLSLFTEIRSLFRGCLWWVGPPCSSWVWLSRSTTGRSITRPQGRQSLVYTIGVETIPKGWARCLQYPSGVLAGRRFWKNVRRANRIMRRVCYLCLGGLYIQGGVKCQRLNNSCCAFKGKTYIYQINTLHCSAHLLTLTVLFSGGLVPSDEKGFAFQVKPSSPPPCICIYIYIYT